MRCPSTAHCRGVTNTRVRIDSVCRGRRPTVGISAWKSPPCPVELSLVDTSADLKIEPPTAAMLPLSRPETVDKARVHF